MTLLKTDVHDRIISRPFEGEDDFWRVRDLLITTYFITPTGFNWDIRRWDGWRFHRVFSDITPEWSTRIQLWETDDGRPVGVVHPDDSGTAALQLHPDYRHLEAEMIAWAEDNLLLCDEDHAVHTLQIPVLDYDIPRRRILEQRGYEILPWTFVMRRLRFGGRSLPRAVVPAGYAIRSTTPTVADYQGVAAVLNAGFNRTIHTAQEFKNFATHSPSYRHDLNLVAEAPDGTFAALVGVTFDADNGRGIIEPVCTHPDHRRKGLARALMLEGMQRVKALGATDVYVDTGDGIAANALYDEIGFTEAYRGSIWRKKL